jgi:hypothetical protein
MESIAAKVGKDLDKGALDALPSELAAEIWGFLDNDEDTRRRLFQRSPSVREAFSPVVQSLRVSLASSSSSLLGGLHSGICVRKLTLVNDLDDNQTDVQKEQIQAALSLLPKTPHFRRVMDLQLKVRPAGASFCCCGRKQNETHACTNGAPGIKLLPGSPTMAVPFALLQGMHLDLEAALHLSPLLHSIEALRLYGCQVDKSSLAVLGNCKHLKQLTLVRTKLAAGAGHALHVLATEGCPGLELTLYQCGDASPDAPFSFWHLWHPASHS